jgi:hypothetical protein
MDVIGDKRKSVDSIVTRVSRAKLSPVALSPVARTLNDLRIHPQFNELQQVLTTNPDALDAVLKQIKQQDPAFFYHITSNFKDFRDLIWSK